MRIQFKFTGLSMVVWVRQTIPENNWILVIPDSAHPRLTVSPIVSCRRNRSTSPCMLPGPTPPPSARPGPPRACAVTRGVALGVDQSNFEQLAQHCTRCAFENKGAGRRGFWFEIGLIFHWNQVCYSIPISERPNKCAATVPVPDS